MPSSQIGKTVRFKGEVFCEEDLFVDGQVEGGITLPKHMLVVGTHSRVKANVKARRLVIHGTLHGSVDIGERIEIKKTGHLEGSLITDRLVIEDGGIFRGQSETRRPNIKPAEKPAGERPVAKAPAAPPSAGPAPGRPAQPVPKPPPPPASASPGPS